MGAKWLGAEWLAPEWTGPCAAPTVGDPCHACGSPVPPLARRPHKPCRPAQPALRGLFHVHSTARTCRRPGRWTHRPVAARRGAAPSPMARQCAGKRFRPANAWPQHWPLHGQSDTGGQAGFPARQNGHQPVCPGASRRRASSPCAGTAARSRSHSVLVRPR